MTAIIRISSSRKTRPNEAPKFAGYHDEKGNLILEIIIILLILFPLSPMIGSDEGKQASHTVRSGDSSVIDIKLGDEVLVPIGGTKCEISFMAEEFRGVNATVDSITSTMFPNDMSIVFKVHELTGLGLLIPGGQATGGSFWIELPPNASVLSARYGDDRMRSKIEFTGVDKNGNVFHIEEWIEIAFTYNVAVLVQKEISEMIYEKLERYEDDVKTENNVEFINVFNRWETPESIRDDLVTLWSEEGISGSMLVGDFPLPIWEIWRFGRQDELCPIPIFYEDMDGSFLDNDSNGIYNKHYWGINDGPEIWTSFLTPPSQTIPPSNLIPEGSPSPGGLKATYYRECDFSNPILTRTDREVFFDWGGVEPPNPAPIDTASVEWKGKVFADRAEKITFEIICGGGLTLEVDGKVMINEPDTPSYYRKTLRSEVELESGWHGLRIRFCLNGDTGYIRMCWRSDGIVGDLINGWFDRDHSFRKGDTEVPQRGLLFMDYDYGSLLQDRMRIEYVEPLFGSNFDCPGGKPATNATEYHSALDAGHELTWVWSHSCPYSHCIDPDVPSYSLIGKNGSVVTLIWGCHAGDFSEIEDDSAKTTNLVINYAFNTRFGLAAAGCGRSFGTDYAQVLSDWNEGGILGLGYFHFSDLGNNKSMRMSETHDLGAEMWVENEVLVGDPFIKMDHKPSRPHIEIGNGSMFASGLEIQVSIESVGATEMMLSYNGKATEWIPFDSSFVLPSQSEGSFEIRVWTRNSYGISPYSDSDMIWIEYSLPILERLTVNGGKEYANSSKVHLDLTYSDALSGVEKMSFSNDGSAWSGWEDVSREKEWTLLEGDGPRTVYARVMDRAGNVCTTVRGSIVVDSTPPLTELRTSGEEGENGWHRDDVTVTLAAHDEHLLKTRCRIGDGEWFDYAGEFVIADEGSVPLRFRSLDSAGNVEEEKSEMLKIDRTGPYGLSISTADRFVNVTTLELRIDAKDEVSGLSSISLSADSYNWEPWRDFAPNVIYVIPRDGTNELFLRVKDVAGNVNWTVEPLTVRLDSIGPRLLSHEPPDGGSLERDLAIALVFSEAMEILPGDITINDAQGASIDFDQEEAGEGRYMINAAWRGYAHYTVTISGEVRDLFGNRMGSGENFSFGIVGIPPEPPRNLTGDAVEGKVVLKWDPPLHQGDLDVIGYRILRTSNGTEEAWIANGSSFVDASVVPGSEYSYRVIPFNMVENGLPSEEVSVAIPPEVRKEQGSDRPNIIPILMIALVLLLLVVMGYLLLRKRSKHDEE